MNNDSKQAVPQTQDKVRLGRDLFMVVLAILSIVMVAYDEFGSIDAATRHALVMLDWLIVLIFASEFSARWWRSEDKLRFLRRNWWEVPGMVPMGVGQAGFLRLLRLLRLVRLVRVFRTVTLLKELRQLNESAEEFVEASRLGRTSAIALVVMVSGAVAIWFIESSNPAFRTFDDALWWAVVTMATVGYGDVVPITAAGRTVAAALMLAGIGLIGVLSATIAQALLRSPHADDASDDENDLVEKLERLVRLHEAGRLDAEQFELAKHRVLGS